MTRPLYVWLFDGEPVAGDLDRYAADVVSGWYCDLDPVGVPALVGRGADGGLVLEPVELTRDRSGWGADDWMTVILTAGDDSASYRLDGRRT